MEKQVLVAVYAFVINEHDQILLGKRKKVFGHGLWTTPSGHFEYNETLEDSTIRELSEEAGLHTTFNDLELVAMRNIPEYVLPNGMQSGHYVAMAFKVNHWTGEPQNLEPDKCFGWEWHDIDNLPQREELFPGFSFLFDCYQQGELYLPNA